MTDHLKLTDEVLERATIVLDRGSVRYEDTRMSIAAIRAIRDAAEEVVLRAGESPEPVPPHLQAAINALAALLPEVPRG